MQVGVYIHVPFCLRKCHYCDFYSLPAGRSPAHAEAFVEALCREMALVADEHGGRGRFEATTLFLGGGTPSLLTPAQLERILGAAHHHFRLTPDAEVTVEANPGTLDAAKACAFRALGVNRVSLGVQCLDDALLRRLGREHDAAQSLAAFQILRDAGFDNLSVDLIFALPGQTLSGWQETLAQTVALRPEHVSAYSLIIEEGTPFAEWHRRGKLPRPDDDLELAMLETGIAQLTAGYAQMR